MKTTPAWQRRANEWLRLWRRFRRLFESTPYMCPECGGALETEVHTRYAMDILSAYWVTGECPACGWSGDVTGQNHN